MNPVHIHDAKTHLPRLVEDVTANESPVAGETRRLGFLEGHIRVPDDFDRMGSMEIEELFSTH